jgi:hypothetical protein
MRDRVGASEVTGKRTKHRASLHVDRREPSSLPPLADAESVLHVGIASVASNRSECGPLCSSAHGTRTNHALTLIKRHVRRAKAHRVVRRRLVAARVVAFRSRGFPTVRSMPSAASAPAN